jgi:NAD(P)H-dependent FMN reductase
MATLLGLSGSLRQKSFNTAVLNAATELVPEGTRLVVHSIRGIPLYDGDVEATSGIPPTVTELKEAIARADGLLIVTPEYNNSIPGVLKNAIDWTTRPDADIKRIYGGKPVALMGASPGGFGTILSQNAWLGVIKSLGALLWSERRLLVSRAHTLMDAEGRLADPKTREQVQAFLEAFAAFVDARAR